MRATLGDPSRRLCKQPTLNFGERDLCRAIRVIIGDIVDPTADGITPHQARIVRLQEFRRLPHLSHPRIEPQIVAVGIQDDGHAVVDRRGHGVRQGGQDRASLNDRTGCVLPAVPYPGERKQLALADLKAVRLPRLARPPPLVESVRRQQAPAKLQRVTKRGLLGRCLCPGVNHPGSCGGILRP